MKTPDKIKKGLECCFTEHVGCDYCPYVDEFGVICTDGELGKDALTYIKQLESERDMYKEKYMRLKENAGILSDAVNRLERELDAAVESLAGECSECAWNQTMTGKCIGCVHNDTAFMPGIDNWEWRGVCEENSGKEAEKHD